MMPLPAWEKTPGATRIRVGYVSSDFGDHPTSHLI
jgi:protein O-GlcNAc transferase